MHRRNDDHLPLFDDLLRPYQRDAIIALRAAYRQGMKALLFCLPTGMGKTRTATLLPRDGAKILVLCGQDMLVRQWVADIRSLRKQAAAIEQTRHSWWDGEDWAVATFQTLATDNGGEPRWKRMVGQFNLIIFDECDTFFTRDIRNMLREFMDSGTRVLGVTATPYRGKKKDSLFGFFEGCPYSYELRNAFDEGWLVGKHAKVFTHRVKSINLDSRSFSKAAADFDPVELERELMREAPLHDMANLIARYHNPRTGHAMVRCVRKNQAKALAELLSDRYGLKTACVFGSQTAAEREENLDRFRSGEATIITNVRVLGRGVDIPAINECFNCAPTKSKATYTQMLGRMTRTVGNCLEGCDTAEERLAAIAASVKPSWVLHDLTATSEYHTPVTAIDILCRDTELVDRIKEDHKGDDEPDEMSIDDLDAEELAEQSRLKELARLEREAERERKRKLVVGVTFDSKTRDLWDAANAKTPKVQTYRFLWGKYCGRPLRDPLVTLDYLYWYLEKQTKPMWIAAVRKEIERREQVHAEAQQDMREFFK